MVPNFGYVSVSFWVAACLFESGRRFATGFSHSSSCGTFLQSGIPAGPWWKCFRVQLAKWKGPDVVRQSDVTELWVFKGQTELLDKCHRHHIDIGAVFLMLWLCLLGVLLFSAAVGAECSSGNAPAEWSLSSVGVKVVPLPETDTIKAAQKLWVCTDCSLEN